MAGFFDFIKHSSDKSTQKQVGGGNTMSVKGNQQYSGIGNPPSLSQNKVSSNQVPLNKGVSSDVQQKIVNPSVKTDSINNNNNPQGLINQDPSSKKQASVPKEPLKEKKTDKKIPKREQLDLMTHLTQRSNRVFLSAQNKAKELNSQLVDSEHLLHGLISDGEVYKLFTEAKIQPQIIEEELNKIYKRGKTALEKQPQLSPRVKRILNNSLISARKLGFEFISPEHILLALFEEGEGIGARVLVKLGLKKQDLNKKIIGKKEGLAGDKDSQGKTKKSSLDQFTIDLTAKATQGEIDPVVERSDVIERVIHILSRRTKNNPALVGEAGVGKTAVVEGLAQKIVDRKVPEPLLDKKILSLDLMSMLAGASHRGEFEERMKNLIKDVKDR